MQQFAGDKLYALSPVETALPGEGGVNQSSPELAGQETSPLRGREAAARADVPARTSPPAGSAVDAIGFGKVAEAA
jgi:hypothetical protein